MYRFLSNSKKKSTGPSAADPADSLDSRRPPSLVGPGPTTTFKRSGTPVTRPPSSSGVGGRRRNLGMPKFSKNLFNNDNGGQSSNKSVSSLPSQESSENSTTNKINTSSGGQQSSSSSSILARALYHLTPISSLKPLNEGEQASFETPETYSLGYSFDTEDGNRSFAANSILTTGTNLTTATGETEQRGNLSPMDTWDDFSYDTYDTGGEEDSDAGAGVNTSGSSFGLMGIGISTFGPPPSRLIGRSEGGNELPPLSPPRAGGGRLPPRSPPRPVRAVGLPPLTPPRNVVARSTVARPTPTRGTGGDGALAKVQTSGGTGTADEEDSAGGWAVETFLSKFSCGCAPPPEEPTGSGAY